MHPRWHLISLRDRHHCDRCELHGVNLWQQSKSPDGMVLKKKVTFLRVTLEYATEFELLFCELECDRLTAIGFHVSTVLYGGFPFGSTAYRIGCDVCQFCTRA